MSETIALARLALQKQRSSLIVISSIVGLGVVSSFALDAGSVPSDRNYALVALCMSMVPAVVWTLGMFSFASDRDLLLGESGFSHWMLRQPIADWKLALVPITLKTIWISLLWIIFALTAGEIADENISVVLPAIAFSAVGIWLMVLMWRPFINGWWRLGAFALCGIVLYAIVVGVLIEVEKGNSATSSWLLPEITVGTLSMFALGIWMSYRAIHLARTNALGLVPEKRLVTERRRSKTTAGKSATKRRRRRLGPRAALVWHDLQKSREVIRWFIVLGVIPALILFSVFMPFSIVGFVAVMTVFSYFGFGASSLVLDRSSKGMIVLPPYLAASPLGTAAIAWTRLCTIVLIVLVTLSLGMVVFAAWTLFPINRATWNTWAGQMSEATGVASAGIGIAIALFLSTVTFVIGRAIAYIWPAMSGRQWVHFVAVVIGVLAYMFPICLGIAWFLQQTDWDSTKVNALYWVTYLPWLVVPWLLAKATIVAWCVAELRIRNLASVKAIGLVIAIWLIFTCTVAYVLDMTVPYPWATLPWCFAAVAMSTPLARALALPISLHFGRHQ